MRVSWTACPLVLCALAFTPPRSAAQAVEDKCPGGRVETDVGYNRFDCFGDCILHVRDGWVEFGSEPVMRGIRANGPAGGLFEDGDALVAVDNMLITTPEGGRRWATLVPGETVVVTVRRRGRERMLRFTPGVFCAEVRSAATAPAPARGKARRGTTNGAVGFAIRCQATCRSSVTDDGRQVWTFEGHPMIAEIRTGGAADRAGVRPGDELLAVDRYSLLSPEGGRRFGNWRPGERVHLTIRRAGEEQTLVLLVEAGGEWG